MVARKNISKSLKISLFRFRSKRAMTALFVVAFALVGTVILIAAHAATGNSEATVSPQSGQVSGNASVISDSTAIGGKSVLFGSGTSKTGTGSAGDSSTGTGGTGTSKSRSSDYTKTVYDSFSGNSLRTSLWDNSDNAAGTVKVSDGELRLGLDPSHQEVEIDANKYYNVENGIWAIKWNHTGTGTVDTSGDSNAGTESYFGLADKSNHYIEFQTFPPSNTWYALNATGKGDFSPSSQVTGKQNAFGSGWTANDYLGIGNYNINNDGYLHLYSSPNGVTWTEIGSVYAAGYVDFTNVELYIGTWQHTGTASWVSTYQDASYFARK